MENVQGHCEERFRLSVCKVAPQDARIESNMSSIPAFPSINDRVTWYMIDVFFTLAFVLEAFLRINTHYLKYFQDAWNLIDIFLVIIAVWGVTLRFVSV